MEQSKIIDTLETYQLSPRCRADGTLPRHFAGSRVWGTPSSWTCVELGGVVHSVLDRSEREEVRLHQLCCQTLPLSVYEGTWTHSPPLIAMHLLYRSCVSVDFFEIACYVPNKYMNSSNYGHHRKVSRLLSPRGLRIITHNRCIWLGRSDLEHRHNGENINGSDLKSWHSGPSDKH